MIRISNILIAFINTFTLVTSLAAIGASFWFLVGLPSVSPCQKFIQQPLLILGSSLFLLSFFALIGSCCRVQFFLWIYLFFLFVLIVGLMCFTVFTIVVTNKGVGEVVSGRGYKEHRLGNYSNWLQNYVLDDQHWDEIKSCFVEFKVCKKIEDDPDETRDDLIKRKLSPIQSGCCKPPPNCGKNAAGPAKKHGCGYEYGTGTSTGTPIRQNLKKVGYGYGYGRSRRQGSRGESGDEEEWRSRDEEREQENRGDRETERERRRRSTKMIDQQSRRSVKERRLIDRSKRKP